MKRLRFCVLVISFLSLNTIGLTATQPILVHVLDTTGTEGVPGVVVLISSLQSHKVGAYSNGCERGRDRSAPQTGLFAPSRRSIRRGCSTAKRLNLTVKARRSRSFCQSDQSSTRSMYRIP
jgi:hypothetical protein